jgi:hypothetical protein
VSDVLSVFDSPEERALPDRNLSASSLMTDSQRKLIREAFARLEIADAKSQFSLINDLMGLSIKSVADLSFQSANILLPLLKTRVDRLGQRYTGNDWDDRTEDTWIDKL